jgi:hypothetical protein
MAPAHDLGGKRNVCRAVLRTGKMRVRLGLAIDAWVGSVRAQLAGILIVQRFKVVSRLDGRGGE